MSISGTSSKNGIALPVILGLAVSAFLLDLQSSIDDGCLVTLYIAAFIGVLLLKTRNSGAVEPISPIEYTSTQRRPKATVTRRVTASERIASKGMELNVDSILDLFESEAKAMTLEGATDILMCLAKVLKTASKEVRDDTRQDPRFVMLLEVLSETLSGVEDVSASTISDIFWGLSFCGCKVVHNLPIIEQLATIGKNRMPDATVGYISCMLWSIVRMSEHYWVQNSNAKMNRGMGNAGAISFGLPDGCVLQSVLTDFVNAAATQHIRNTVRPRKIRDLSTTAWAFSKLCGPDLTYPIRLCMRDIGRECANSVAINFEKFHIVNLVTAFFTTRALSDHDQSNLFQLLARHAVTTGIVQQFDEKEADAIVTACARSNIRSNPIFNELCSRFAPTDFVGLSATSIQCLCQALLSADTRNDTNTDQLIDAMVAGVCREYDAGRCPHSCLIGFIFSLARNDWAVKHKDAVARLVHLYVDNAKDFDACSQTTVAWAIARAGVFDERVFEAVAARLKGALPSLPTYNLSNVIWAFGRCRSKQAAFFEELLDEATNRVPAFSKLEIRSILVGCLTTGRITPKLLAEVMRYRATPECPSWWEPFDTLIARLRTL